jgi:hypothetical protein
MSAARILNHPSVPPRGVVKDRHRAEQGRDFSDLRFGTITPTDIDAAIDFGDRVFVWMEAKYGGARVVGGQRLHLERVCDAVSETGRHALVLTLGHHTPPEDQIDFGECYVTEYRYKRRWGFPPNSMTPRMAIQRFLKRVGHERA